NVVFLRRGMAMLPSDQRDDHARGLILAFVVDDLESELARLQAEGVTITMPLRSEEWGERAFQVRDPNGVIVELLDWNAAKARRDHRHRGREGCGSFRHAGRPVSVSPGGPGASVARAITPRGTRGPGCRPPRGFPPASRRLPPGGRAGRRPRPPRPPGASGR